jgi:membrane protein YdbS with pleckstrin-like domain
MFCKQCGTEVEDDAKFCSNCGFSFTPKKKVNSKKVLFSAKPVFIPWVTALSVLPLQLFFTVWAGGFFGGFSLFGIKALGLDIPLWFPFVFFACLAFFGIPFLTYYAKKKTYAKTEYKFYSDRLEYAEGFWTAENKSIKYKNITEANFRKGVIQKKYGLGTIILSTPAAGFQHGRARSGIAILDIENTEDIYNKIKDLID